MGFIEKIKKLWNGTEPPTVLDDNTSHSHTNQLQEAADICPDSSGDDQYYEDDIFDIFVNYKYDPTHDNVTIVQIKPVRGSSKRVTVLSYKSVSKHVIEYHPQVDFWENRLLEISERFKATPFDIDPKDKRRVAIDTEKRIEQIRSKKK